MENYENSRSVYGGLRKRIVKRILSFMGIKLRKRMVKIYAERTAGLSLVY